MMVNGNIYTNLVYTTSMEWFNKTDLDSLYKTLELLDGGEVPEYSKIEDDLAEYML